MNIRNYIDNITGEQNAFIAHCVMNGKLDELCSWFELQYGSLEQREFLKICLKMTFDASRKQAIEATLLAVNDAVEAIATDNV